LIVLYHRVRKLNIQDVIDLRSQRQDGSGSNDDFELSTGYHDQPRLMNLSVLFHNPKKGAFKIAWMGSSNLPLSTQMLSEFKHDSEFPICVKQVFYLNAEKKTAIPGNNIQLKDLSMEARGLVWAHSLHEIPCGFVEKELAKKGLTEETAPIDFPKLHYVEAGLALTNDVTNKDGKVLLVEQKIEGTFHKYLNNGSSALPEFFANAEVGRITRFLSFCQHVQYWKTQKLAFIADYQGMLSKLVTAKVLNDVCRGCSSLDRPSDYHPSVSKNCSVQ
jgi:hypothetical protein